MKYNTLLFPRKADQTNFSLFLLSMRLLFGSLLMTHGYAKLMGFAAMSASFPDPFGIGSRYSLMLAMFSSLCVRFLVSFEHDSDDSNDGCGFFLCPWWKYNGR